MKNTKLMKKNIVASIITVIVLVVMLTLVGKSSYEGKSESVISEFNQGLYQ